MTLTSHVSPLTSRQMLLNSCCKILPFPLFNRPRRRRLCNRLMMANLLTFLFFCFALSQLSPAYVLEGATWPYSPVNVQMDLSSTTRSLQYPPAFPLYDGSASWEQVYTAATQVWNAVMANLQLTATPSSGTSLGTQDGINEAYFGTNIAGYNLQPSDLAITVIYYEGSTMVEADTVFKSTVPWNSYPGPLLNSGNGPIDFRRVAIHELGHTIGLADINGTNPLAIMDIDVSDIYVLTSDDIAGAQTLYGAPAAANGTHPPLGANRNGQAELVWENTITGERSIWVMHDGVPAFVINLPTLPIEWNIAAAADFLGTGQADLVWENTVTGERSIWILNNGALSSVISLPTVPIQWHITAAADFLGTGQADLVWENTVTGERSIWILNNGVPSSIINLPTVPIQWHIAAAADFLGTGQADLVWENTVTGERSIWVMHGGVPASIINLPTIATEWAIADAADFLGTGQADLVWANRVTGERSIWILHSGVFSSTINLPTVPPEWRIVD
jgi:Matrixin